MNSEKFTAISLQTLLFPVFFSSGISAICMWSFLFYLSSVSSNFSFMFSIFIVLFYIL